MRVLVVEDHRAMREIVTGHLRDRGFAVDGVQRADEALAAAAAIDYDAVILDLGLPDADGMEVLRQLRSRDIGLPTLVLTARDRIEDRVGGLNGRADDYILKPFNLAELEARLRAVLRRPGPRRQASYSYGDLRARQTIAESVLARQGGSGDSLRSWRIVVSGMIDEDSLQKLQMRNAAIMPQLDERQRRLFAASEARAAGHGGIAAVSRVTHIAASTIGRGLKELDAPPRLRPGSVRRPGGGRKSLTEADPSLLDDLNALVEPDARGDPMSPLRWTCKSLRRLAEELDKLGHKISHTVVGELLKKQKFSLQAKSKTREGADNPDRDAQFQVVNDAVKTAMAENQPAISVDTKKKELIGDFKNAGREWRKQGDPEEVRVHDFLIKELGRAVPYGIYDLAANAGWVSVGIDNDTAAFAVQTIRRWWQDVGHVRYPLARRLVITADGGGSNGSRVRLWKLELQRLADELGISIEVHHLPPGTSKWNKIEHRLFSFITQNWRAKPLLSYRVIVELIGATTTRTGLTVRCELDAKSYPKGIIVSDDEMRSLNIQHADFHGGWNYTIAPSSPHIKAVDS